MLGHGLTEEERPSARNPTSANVGVKGSDSGGATMHIERKSDTARAKDTRQYE